MEPTKELGDALYREKVLRAREAAPSEKLWDGARLFEGVCGRMKDGIRARFPEADEARVHAILREQLKRLARIRRL